MKFSKIEVILIVLIVCVFLFPLTGCKERAAVAEPSLEEAISAISPAEAKVAEPVADTNGPRIEFEKVVHDFGKVGPGTNHSCDFNFTNTGTDVLKIGKVKTTCRCSVPEMKKKEYAPGESGTVTVRYNPFKTEKAGGVTRKLFVPSNDTTNPSVMLTLKAVIEVKINYEPKNLKLLLKDENADCPDIKIRSIDGKAFAIKRIDSTANSITADFDPNIEATEFVLKPKVDVEKLKKGLSGHINIHLSHPEGDLVTIFFEALPRFKVLPATINVLNAKPDQPYKREIWILNNYDEDFEIESVSSSKGYIEVLCQEKIDSEETEFDRYKIELKITPPPTDGKKRVFNDTLVVSIKGGEKLELNCHGFYAKNNNGD